MNVIIRFPSISFTITNISNVNGGWGRGFVLAITERFGKLPEQQYRQYVYSDIEIIYSFFYVLSLSL